jgi:hypothetical protein
MRCRDKPVLLPRRIEVFARDDAEIVDGGCDRRRGAGNVEYTRRHAIRAPSLLASLSCKKQFEQ